jgi:CelD/BcsL family acetyltransferase involved in cellulose biosynthesis
VRDTTPTSEFEEVTLRSGEQQLGSVVAEWRDLAARIDGSSFFQTPDWVLAWWEDRDRPPTRIGLWRDASDRLEAVAYLSRVREPLRHSVRLTIPVVINSGSGRPHSADRCGWPVLPHRIGEVREWAAQRHWRGAVLARHLDHGTGRACVPAGAHRVLDTRGPVLAWTGSDPVIARSKNFAKKVRRYQRRLDELGVSFTWTPPERVTTDAIDVLFELRARSRSPRGGSSFTAASHSDLHRRLVESAFPGCGPATVVAAVDGRPIGIEYGFVWRDTFYDYQAGWDAAYAKLNLGTLLTVEAIRLAAQHGYRAIDFLRGAEPYKYRFGASDMVDETWLLPRGASGMLLEWKYRRARADQRRDHERVDAAISREERRRVVDANERVEPFEFVRER